MKTISTALHNHYQQETTTIAMCWRVELVGGTVLGFTNAATDLPIGGLTYSASTGFTPSSVQTSSQFNVDNLEVTGVLDSTVIREADLIAGVWDYAKISVFEVNYMDLSMGANPIRDGYLGQVSTQRNLFVAELRGLLQFFQQPVGRSIGYVCDANFCDSRCKLNLSTWTSTGVVTGVASGRIINCSLTHSSWLYAGGLITMTSGAASGFKREIRAYTSPNQLVLQELFPYAPSIGDTFSISAGCDKLYTTCADTYSNITNFRGFWQLPAQDKLISGT